MLGGRIVKAHDLPLGKEGDQISQAVIGGDLTLAIGRAMNHGQPAAQLFFDDNDGDCEILIR